MRETANSRRPAPMAPHRPPGGGGTLSGWKCRCGRRRASQRIRVLADERHTAINYNNRPGARLVAGHGVKTAILDGSSGGPAARRLPNTPARRRGVNPRQRPGVSMFGISFVSDCALRRSPHRGGS